ncbi:protein painting of fourth [Drosophila busckii]|uniref:protein painting of fourth n=1 Tax=Drosophila busckii TaxID=30019 RepID=UPI00083F49C9|nr:protein painting of fourth [Drosophila busckii]
MDLKLLAVSQKTGLGDGPDAKRVIHQNENNEDKDQELHMDAAVAQSDPAEDKDTDKDSDFMSMVVERGSLLPSNHVPAYTGNGCESTYLPQQAPAGGQLLPWIPFTGAPPNDVATQFEDKTIELKLNRKNIKLNRKEQYQVRRQNALRALALERELSTKTSPTPTLLIRFPDPEIKLSTVTDLSQSIRDVVFPVSMAQRYCMVHLKPDVDIERTIEDIKRMRFGQGRLHAELKTFTDDEQADCIDPCSLYVSNIPFNMNAAEIKAFLNSMRVDIGVMKRQKRARYAFVRYPTAELAMEAFRTLTSKTLQNRILTVRYRRLRKRMGPSTSGSPGGTSSQTIDTIVTDEDTAECSVISPPPAESITISDSEEHCSNDSVGSICIEHKQMGKGKLNEFNKKFQKLQRQMAEQAALIKNLQESVVGRVKIEAQSDLTTDKSSMVPRSISPCSSYEIKMANDYLGVAQSTLNTVSPHSSKAPKLPIDGMESAVKSNNCFGWLFSGLGRRRSFRIDPTTNTNTQATN